MNDKKLRVKLLIGIFLLVLAAPLYLVIKSESHLSNKDFEYKFRIRPYDPSDPVRGRYIRLFFSVDMYIAAADEFQKNENAHIIVERDGRGWAYFKSAHKETPPAPNYFTAEVKRSHEDKVMVDLSFDRYYLNEELAPLGETEYRNLASDRDSTFYAVVTIKDGEALLKEVYYKDEPYRDYLRRLVDESEVAEN